MNSLLLGKSNEVEYNDLRDIPIPMATTSYSPVSHSKLIDVITYEVDRANFDIDSLRIGLQNTKVKDTVIKGAKMFAMMDLVTDHNDGTDDIKMSIGIRNSYDKSMSVGLAIGAKVMVCDNMMMTGEMVALRKHTTNVWNDVLPMVITLLGVARRQHTLDREMRDKFKQEVIALDKGLDLLGKMAAHGFLKYIGGNGSQFAIAIDQWINPSFEEFDNGSIWSLYNACTYGSKKNTLSNVMSDNAIITTFFRKHFANELHKETLKLGKEVRIGRELLST